MYRDNSDHGDKDMEWHCLVDNRVQGGKRHLDEREGMEESAGRGEDQFQRQ